MEPHGRADSPFFAFSLSGAAIPNSCTPHPCHLLLSVASRTDRASLARVVGATHKEVEPGPKNPCLGAGEDGSRVIVKDICHGKSGDRDFLSMIPFVGKTHGKSLSDPHKQPGQLGWRQTGFCNNPQVDSKLGLSLPLSKQTHKQLEHHPPGWAHSTHPMGSLIPSYTK